jgi:hypothetical protein
VADNLSFLDATGTPRTIRFKEVSPGIWAPVHVPMNAYQRDTAGASDDYVGMLGGRQFSDPIASPVADESRVPLIVDNRHRLWVRLAADETVAVALEALSQIIAADRADVIYDGTTAMTPKFATFSVAGDTANSQLVDAVTGKHIVVTNLAFTVGATAGSVNFGSRTGSTTTSLTNTIALDAYGGMAPGYDPTGHFRTAVTEKLVITTVGTPVSGWLKYVEMA